MATKTKSAVAVAEAPDFMAAVKANATAAKPAAKKNDKPTVILPENLKVNLAAVSEAKAALAKAKADIDTNAEPIISYIRGVQDEDGVKGAFSGSYKLDGGDVQALFVSADKWSVPQDDAVKDELKAIGAGSAIRERYEITVKDEVMLDKALQAEFMAAVGAAFAKFFDAKRVFETVPGLNENIYKLAGGDKVRVAKIRELVKQSSPYIK